MNRLIRLLLPTILLAILAVPAVYAANSFYNSSGAPAQGSAMSSSVIRTEFANIGAGFDKMPALTAGTAVVVNGSGTALTNTVGTLALAGNLSTAGAFSTTGAFSLTLAQQGNVTLTLPATSDTLVGRATTDTLTNKSISGSTNTLTNIGNSSLTNSAVTIAGHSVSLGGSTAIAAADLSNGVQGTGAIVLASAPTITSAVLVTPTLGVATATSINKVAFTTPATGATLALADGKTLTVSNTMTLAATDGSAPFTLATRQVLTSGTGATYTTPAGVRQLRIMIKGGGGGGSGGGAGATGGGAGGTSSFDNASANVRAAGGTQGTGSTGGAGGTGGGGSASYRIPGSRGGNPNWFAISTTNASVQGGNGAGPGGGAGGGLSAGALNGSAAIANSGGGGGGGNTASDTYANIWGSAVSAGGGGEGETAYLIINNPSGTYLYTVGAGGTAGGAGTGGGAGAAGGSGLIVVEEIY